MEAQSTSDAESRSRLLNAAKLLADATTKMVEVAKVLDDSCNFIVALNSRFCTDRLTIARCSTVAVFLVLMFLHKIMSVKDLLCRVVRANLMVRQRNRKQ